MKSSRQTKRIVVSATTAALLGVAALSTAQAAPQPRSKAGVTADKGIPSAVDPATDLAAQPADAGKTFTDSIYINSEVKAGGHDYGINVITMRNPNSNAYTLGF